MSIKNFEVRIKGEAKNDPEKSKECCDKKRLYPVNLVYFFYCNWLVNIQNTEL